MEKNNKTVCLAVGALLLGLLIGWVFWGQSGYKVREGMHQMPGGMMMNDMDNGMHNNMSMRQMMDAMTVGLQDKTGSDFDSAFLEEMIPHHQGAIDMARMVLATSKRPELIKMANDIISAQQKEIETMRGWQKSWFGVNPL